MNKRGQFFLITAIIIVGLVIGLAATINTIRISSEDAEVFYDLSEEIGFEAKRVLDYGVYNNRDLESVLNKTLDEYVNYIAHNEVLFIQGNEEKLFVYAFKEQEQGTVGISTGAEVPAVIEIQYTEHVKADVRTQQEGEDLKILVDVIESDISQTDPVRYEFTLREGENFFFLIIKEEEDERFVSRG